VGSNDLYPEARADSSQGPWEFVAGMDMPVPAEEPPVSGNGDFHEGGPDYRRTDYREGLFDGGVAHVPVFVNI